MAGINIQYKTQQSTWQQSQNNKTVLQYVWSWTGVVYTYFAMAPSWSAESESVWESFVITETTDWVFVSKRYAQWLHLWDENTIKSLTYL